MAIDPRHQAVNALMSKSAALDKLSSALTNQLTGDFNHDAPIHQVLAAMNAESTAIWSRMKALTSAQPFTAPTDDQVNQLGAAVAAVNQAAAPNATLNALMAAATTILSQYGSQASQ